MPSSWADDPATTNTHVRSLHINQLRDGVDSARAGYGLGPYPWSDGSRLSSAIRIRAQHFIEIKQAIQDLWNRKNRGSIPNWSVGSAPSAARQVSARDMNDLRRWFNQWELSTDPALCGINWRSPVDGSNPVTNTQNQFNSGAGFGSALVLSHSGTPPQGESAAESAISWIVNSRRCSASGTTSANEAVIVRLFYPKQQTLPASASDLAGMWHNVIQYCQGVGVYNFVVLNEPDLEYSGQLWNPTNPQYMSDLSDALRSQNPGTLYLGFPSPSAEFGDPSSSQWQQYWGDYGNVISMKYNNLAVHVYGSDMSALQTRVSQRLPDLRGRFPNLPQRLTEYGVPITAYGGDHGARGSDYGSFIKNFMRTSTYSYVLACHAFIARDSPDFGTSTSQQYEMTDTEVANLVGVVGCVGQTG